MPVSQYSKYFINILYLLYFFYIYIFSCIEERVGVGEGIEKITLGGSRFVSVQFLYTSEQLKIDFFKAFKYICYFGQISNTSNEATTHVVVFI